VECLRGFIIFLEVTLFCCSCALYRSALLSHANQHPFQDTLLCHFCWRTQEHNAARPEQSCITRKATPFLSVKFQMKRDRISTTQGRMRHPAHSSVQDTGAGTTESMLKSFIFSKPGYTNSPFTSWNTAVHAQKVANDDNRRGILLREACGHQQPSGFQREGLPSVAIYRHQHQPHHNAAREDAAAGQSNEPAAFDLGIARRAMTTAWKRRTFVENVQDIPHMYHHKSVVPAVPISPRIQTHQRPGSSGWMPGGYHVASSQRPTSGVLPCATRPSTAHPMKTVVAQVGQPYHDDERSHQQQRRHLESRVVHLTTCSRGAAAKIVYPGRGLYGTHLYPQPSGDGGDDDTTRHLRPRQSSAPVLQKARHAPVPPMEEPTVSANETQPPPVESLPEDAPPSSTSSAVGSPTAAPRAATNSAPLRRRRPQQSPPGISIGSAEMV
jgi:hypothetical protein